jgi:hypothetical protein
MNKEPDLVLFYPEFLLDDLPRSLSDIVEKRQMVRSEVSERSDRFGLDQYGQVLLVSRILGWDSLKPSSRFDPT